MCFKSNQFLLPENINNERKYKKNGIFHENKTTNRIQKKNRNICFSLGAWEKTSIFQRRLSHNNLWRKKTEHFEFFQVENFVIPMQFNLDINDNSHRSFPIEQQNQEREYINTSE